MVSVTVLGEQSVVDPVSGRIATRSTRSIALIGYLVARTGSPQTRSTIAGAFWPDSGERQALTNLRRELHQLRQVILDDGTLEVTPSHLCWHDGGPHDVDLATFLREHVATLRATDDADVLLHGTAAMAAFRGDLLPGMDDPWLDDVRRDLREHCVAVCDLVCAAAERGQLVEQAADAMRKRIFVDQYDEPAHRRLMELQAAQGDRAGALRTYHRLAGLLEVDLGVAPDPATTRTLALVTRHTAVPEGSSAAVIEARSGPGHPPLVGRADELRSMKQAWSQACQGSASVVLVRGAAGVGKSRIVAELVELVRSAGGIAAVTRCFDSGASLSMTPISDWLRTPAIEIVRAQVDDVWNREVERLVPTSVERGSVRAGRDDAQGTRPDVWQQHRFFEGVARTLLAVDRPLLLVLDDLQWCDADTLRLTTFMLNLEPQARVLVAATARPDVDTVNPAAASWLTEARQARRLTEVPLTPFDADHAAELARSLGGRPLSSEQAELLHELTGGFPLFVVEAARSEGGTDREPGPGFAWSDILHRRLEQTSPAARETAELAAAFGRDFTLALLAEASDLTADSVVLAVDELWRERILRELGEGYDFSHDLLRDAAYARVSPPRRWLLHRRLAQALELLNSGNTRAVAVQLAEQYRLAGDHDRAVTHYSVAATSAEDVFAHAEALSLVDRALTELESLPEGRDRDQRELECRVTATGILLALHGWTSSDLRETTDRIIELAKRLHRPESLVSAMNTLFGLLFVGGSMNEAYEVTERAVALAGGGLTDNPAEAHYSHGGAALHTGRCAEAFDHFGIAHAHNDQTRSHNSVLTHVFSAAWWAHAAWACGMPERAAELAAEAVGEARAHDHDFSLAVALAYGALSHQLLGDRELCERWSDEAINLCDKAGYSYYVDWAHVLHGWCRGAAGLTEVEEAIASLRDAGALARMPYWLALQADVVPDARAASALLDDAVGCAVEHGELLWLPELWRRQAAGLPDAAALELLTKAAGTARDQGNGAALESCEEDVARRRERSTNAPVPSVTAAESPSRSRLKEGP